jgi:hypothetical protein
MQSIKDIKIVLFLGYAVGYLLAILPPIFIDPFVKHARYGYRDYGHASEICIFLFVLFLVLQFVYLWKITPESPYAVYRIFKAEFKISKFYISTLIFVGQISITLPFFLPETPHGNVAVTGATTALLSALATYIWLCCARFSIKENELSASDKNDTLEYIKLIATFIGRSGLAIIATFVSIIFYAYSTGFYYAKESVTDMAGTVNTVDLGLLTRNVGWQLGFVASYALLGPVRYLFNEYMHFLLQFKNIALQTASTSKSAAMQRKRTGQRKLRE